MHYLGLQCTERAFNSVPIGTRSFTGVNRFPHAQVLTPCRRVGKPTGRKPRMTSSLQRPFSSPQYRLIEAGGCTGPEEQVCQSALAQYPANFPQGEKGQQGAKIHHARGQHFGYASVAERRKGTRQTLSVPHSLNRLFQ